MQYISVTPHNIDSQHICCGFSNKKAQKGYALKKQWLQSQFANGWRFDRLDERAKVFVEHGLAENSWLPIVAHNYLTLGCFWVSGKYKGHGHGKALLARVIDRARQEKKAGIAAVVGKHKLSFASDGKWLQQQGFELCDVTHSGFYLLALVLDESYALPKFTANAKAGICDKRNGLVAYYSNRCPFTEYYVNTVLRETAEQRELPLEIIKLESDRQAQQAPTPATIFSLFWNGKFVTSDLGVCQDQKFDAICHKALGRLAPSAIAVV